MQNLNCLFRFALLAVCVSSVSSASQRWISVSTPHFEMYTTNNEKRAIKTLQVFEEVRYFFLQNSKNKQAPEGRVRIIAFSSEKEYKPYRLNGGAFAYYLRSRERDYIVMQDIDPEHHQTAVHEYTHLVVEHTKIKLPVWLNEGLADLYSSLEPRGQQAMVGRPLLGRGMTLFNQRWMDWNLLFSVDQTSPYYNESDKMSIFYAQSWLLTHMLALSPAYKDKFSAFLMACASGDTTPEVLKKVYGKSVDDIAKETEAYIRQNSFKAVVYDVSLKPAELDAQVSDVSELQTGLALADLLASKTDTRPEARQRLLALAQRFPQNSDLAESLGYLAWEEGNLPEATQQFSRAFESGSQNVEMIFNLACFEQNAGAAPAVVTKLLERVIAMKPEHIDARVFLAHLQASQGNFDAALSVLKPVHTVQPDQAFGFFSVLAFSQARAHDWDNARQSAERAQKYAKTAVQSDEIQRLLASIDRATHPAMPSASVAAPPETSPSHERAHPAMPEPEPVHTSLLRSRDLPRVQGETKAFECSKKTFRLRLKVGAHDMVLDLGNLQDIVVRNVKDLTWSCGALPARNLTVVYEPSAGGQIDGTVSELVF